MGNSKILFGLAFSFAVFFFACKKEDGTPAKFYYEYYPDDVGTWVEYDVMYVDRDDASGVNDTTQYKLREIIESTFIDNQGRPSLRIERYWRTANSLPWVIKDVWYATRTTTKLEKIEEDIRYLRLVFAITNDKRWNGNVYNTLDEEEYEYDQLHEPMTISTMNFDSTATVIQRNNTNIIEISEAYEIYANHVGLIKKEDIYFYITYDSVNPPKYTGYAYYQTVTGYGN